MPKRNGTAAGGFAEQSSDSVFKSSEKHFLPDGRQQRRDSLYDRRSIDFTGEGCDEKRLRALFRIPGRGGAFSEGWGGFQGMQR